MQAEQGREVTRRARQGARRLRNEQRGQALQRCRRQAEQRGRGRGVGKVEAGDGGQCDRRHGDHVAGRVDAQVRDAGLPSQRIARGPAQLGEEGVDTGADSSVEQLAVEGRRER